MGLLNPSLAEDVTSGAGGLRDAYLLYVEKAGNQGVTPLPIGEWIKQMQQLKLQQQAPMPNQFNEKVRGLLFKR